MKAGLACQLTAFKALVDAYHPSRQRGSAVSGRLGLAVTVDQEGSSIGARALKTKFGECDAMLHAEHFFGDSPQNYLPIAGTGKLLYRLVIRGRAAHAFRPHRGVNAVDDAARIVSSLDQLPLGEHDGVGRGTACTLKIDGGYQQYAIVVPEKCEVMITRLTVPGETKETAVWEMEELVQSLRLQSKVEVTTCPPSYDPYCLAESTPVLPVFTQVYEKIIGRKPCFSGHSGVTDANVFVAEGGIPTCCFWSEGRRSSHGRRVRRTGELGSRGQSICGNRKAVPRLSFVIVFEVPSTRAFGCPRCGGILQGMRFSKSVIYVLVYIVQYASVQRRF